MQQLAILSGKGGTGKTTVAASLIRLSGCIAFADCDVDAPNLHLTQRLDGAPVTQDYFGYDVAVKDDSVCIQCGKCEELCRFGAIRDGVVDPYACEGCGVCEAFCPVTDTQGRKAIRLVKSSTGKTLVYKTDASVFSSAELKMGSGASGKLVTQVRKNLYQQMNGKPLIIVDGSPGIGCPVVASITGMNWVLVVAEPTISGIHDMERIVDTALRFGSKVWVCINKYDVSPSHTDQIIDYCSVHGIPMVGKIPFDPLAVEAVNKGVSVVEFPDSPAGKSLIKIWESISKLIEQA